MAREYTITEILPTPPKLWKNGIVYYEVRLEGHPNTVSIGKKQPPQPGWTIYGNIESTPDGLADKFTSANRPEAGSPGNAGTSPDAHATNDRQSPAAPAWKGKDEDAIKAMWSIGQAVSIYNTAWQVDQKVDADSFIEIQADKLFAMVDRVKQGTPTVKDRGDFATVDYEDLPPVENYDEAPF